MGLQLVVDGIPYHVSGASSFTRRAELWNTNTNATVALDSATYTLIAEDGTVIYNGVSCTIDDTEASYTDGSPPASIALGRVYQERWTFLATGASSSTEPFASSLYVLPWGPYPLIRTMDLVEMHPDLAVYPTGASNWHDVISETTKRIAWRLLTSGPAARQSMWGWDATRNLQVYAALEAVYRAQITAPGDRYEAQATHYERMAANEWRGLAMAYDTDNDGDLDDIVAGIGNEIGHPGGAGPTR